ncbi:DUF3341 domain-containing protein [Roseomonas elaeocarpi]|uniref:DUF3341 domain-containing protein n=1 Tax=Roseomonas elaeocarpi TaxID=907779 RepID=A0ABV6JY80_9PROT
MSAAAQPGPAVNPRDLQAQRHRAEASPTERPDTHGETRERAEAHDAAPPLILVEFRDPDTLCAAARRVREAGFTALDAHTPFAVEGLAEALALPQPKLRLVMLLAGLGAAAFVYLLCWYSAVFDYPLIVGGRPRNAWQSFAVLCFEAGILAACVAGVAGFFFQARLPRLHHPVFDGRDFRLASQDRFFLSVADPAAEPERLAALLDGLAPLSIRRVEP